MSPSSPDADRAQHLLTAYAQRRASGAWLPARETLLDALLQATPEECLECGRALVLRGDLDTARAVYEAASTRHPDASELHLGLAGLYWQMQQPAQAESHLREWLDSHPADIAGTFLWVRLLREQGRMNAAAEAMLRLFDHGPHDVDTVIQAVELLDDFSRPKEASQICEAAIAAGSQDPRLHAYAGMLGIQLGQFERVREHYEIALAQEPLAIEWNIPIGLSGLQRYRDPNHADFALFRDVLQRAGLSDNAYTQTLFALGKAHDDLGDHAQAAMYWRQANDRAHAHSTWSRKLWQRSIEARLTAKPHSVKLSPAADWTPVFIVGVPRSGTTLLAELLTRNANVRNRGELGWLQSIAQRLSLTPAHEQAAFEDAAALYAAQLRQDDADAIWFIDKQPLNLLHIDLIMTLWPHARIIHCQRDARDTALSLWSQSFHDRAHDYAYDFHDIAAVIQGCRRLMTHFSARYPSSICTVHYEELVTTPDECIAALSAWLGLSAPAVSEPLPTSDGISTASAWQARQPVYTRSAGRWRDHAPYLPELLKIPQR